MIISRAAIAAQVGLPHVASRLRVDEHRDTCRVERSALLCQRVGAQRLRDWPRRLHDECIREAYQALRRRRWEQGTLEVGGRSVRWMARPQAGDLPSPMSHHCGISAGREEPPVAR